MTRASAGAVAVGPTATIRPSRMTMVPRSIAGPETGTIFALVIAYVPGMARSPSCAVAVVAMPASIATASAGRVKRERMRDYSGGDQLTIWRGTGVRWTRHSPPAQARLRFPHVGDR